MPDLGTAGEPFIGTAQLLTNGEKLKAGNVEIGLRLAFSFQFYLITL